MRFPYPALLRPTATETLLLSNGPVAVPKVSLQLRRWAGPPLSHTFGGKGLVDFGGRPLFAELVVYERLRLSGWEARWVEVFGASVAGPKFFTDWQDTLPGQQRLEPIADPAVLDLLHRIAAHNGQSYAGCWDVLGWHQGTVLFAELKRRKKDRLRATQPRWLAAGLAAGLQPENFLLVEWDFADE